MMRCDETGRDEKPKFLGQAVAQNSYGRDYPGSVPEFPGSNCLPFGKRTLCGRMTHAAVVTDLYRGAASGRVKRGNYANKPGC